MISAAIFWIIISISDGGYNRGNLDEMSLRFATQDSCQAVVDQINSIENSADNINIGCVKVGGLY